MSYYMDSSQIDTKKIEANLNLTPRQKKNQKYYDNNSIPVSISNEKAELFIAENMRNYFKYSKTDPNTSNNFNISYVINSFFYHRKDIPFLINNLNFSNKKSDNLLIFLA